MLIMSQNCRAIQNAAEIGKAETIFLDMIHWKPWVSLSLPRPPLNVLLRNVGPSTFHHESVYRRDHIASDSCACEFCFFPGKEISHHDRVVRFIMIRAQQIGFGQRPRDMYSAYYSASLLQEDIRARRFSSQCTARTRYTCSRMRMASRLNSREHFLRRLILRVIICTTTGYVDDFIDAAEMSVRLRLMNKGHARRRWTPRMATLPEPFRICNVIHLRSYFESRDFASNSRCICFERVFIR
jgi:hypothetical protein